MDNTSGQGKGSAVPEEIKGLSWGGFFWNWIWGLFNRVWLSLLVFVPVVGMVVPFVLLFKGREWAWQNKSWESVEHFNSVQRKWSIAALIFLGIGVALIAAGVMMGGLSGDSPSSTQAEIKPPPAKPASSSSSAPAPRPAPAAQAKPAPSPEPAAPVPSAKASDAAAAAPKDGKAPAVAMAAPAPAAAAAPALVAATTTAKADAPAPRPRVRREAPPQPLAMYTPPAVAPKVHTPKYNDLMTAVLKPDREGVSHLLELGRWVDKPDANGVTPLMAAVRNRDTAMAELLLSRGANANVSASNGFSALGISRVNGDSAMTTLLQRAGAR